MDTGIYYEPSYEEWELWGDLEAIAGNGPDRLAEAETYADGSPIRYWKHRVIIGERRAAGRYVPSTEQETDEFQALIEELAEVEGHRFYWSEESAESLRRRILAV